MKDTATINGVTLTRAQVEGALKEMNRPEPRTFLAGKRLSWGASIYRIVQLKGCPTPVGHVALIVEESPMGKDNKVYVEPIEKLACYTVECV